MSSTVIAVPSVFFIDNGKYPSDRSMHIFRNCAFFKTLQNVSKDVQMQFSNSLQMLSEHFLQNLTDASIVVILASDNSL